MLPSSPRVSVALPVHNGERYVSEAIHSVLRQTFHDFELIIYDNASTDGTAEICRSLAQHDARIRYFHSTENVGAAPNFNRALEKGRGEYFKWISHDDTCHPRYLERCVSLLDEDPTVVVAHAVTAQMDGQGRVVRVYSSERPFDKESAHERFYQVITTPHGCTAVFGLMRAEILRQTPLFGSYIGSDRNLLAELSLRGKISLVPEQLYYRRDHPDASVRRFPEERDRLAWFDTRMAGRTSYPTGCRLREYFRSIQSAPLCPDERLSCLFQLLPWLVGQDHSRRRNAILWSRELVDRWQHECGPGKLGEEARDVAEVPSPSSDPWLALSMLATDELLGRLESLLQPSDWALWQMVTQLARLQSRPEEAAMRFGLVGVTDSGDGAVAGAIPVLDGAAFKAQLERAFAPNSDSGEKWPKGQWHIWGSKECALVTSGNPNSIPDASQWFKPADACHPFSIAMRASACPHKWRHIWDMWTGRSDLLPEQLYVDWFLDPNQRGTLILLATSEANVPQGRGNEPTQGPYAEALEVGAWKLDVDWRLGQQEDGTAARILAHVRNWSLEVRSAIERAAESSGAIETLFANLRANLASGSLDGHLWLTGRSFAPPNCVLQIRPIDAGALEDFIGRADSGFKRIGTQHDVTIYQEKSSASDSGFEPSANQSCGIYTGISKCALWIAFGAKDSMAQLKQTIAGDHARMEVEDPGRNIGPRHWDVICRLEWGVGNVE